MSFNIGDVFTSSQTVKLNESSLKDADLQRQMISSYMEKKAMASGDTKTDVMKYVILGGVAVFLTILIIFTKK